MATDRVPNQSSIHWRIHGQHFVKPDFVSRNKNGHHSLSWIRCQNGERVSSKHSVKEIKNCKIVGVINLSTDLYLNILQMANDLTKLSSIHVYHYSICKTIACVEEKKNSDLNDPWIFLSNLDSSLVPQQLTILLKFCQMYQRIIHFFLSKSLWKIWQCLTKPCFHLANSCRFVDWC